MKDLLKSVHLKNVYSKNFYRTYEILNHIKPNDFWVILNRRVLDLSSLMKLLDEMLNGDKNLTVYWLLFIVSVNLIILAIFFYWHLCRHCTSWACSVELTSVNYLKIVQATNWKCSIWNRIANMVMTMIYSGGMIRRALLAASRPKNGIFVCATLQTVNTSWFKQTKLAFIWQINHSLIFWKIFGINCA